MSRRSGGQEKVPLRLQIPRPAAFANARRSYRIRCGAAMPISSRDVTFFVLFQNAGKRFRLPVMKWSARAASAHSTKMLSSGSPVTARRCDGATVRLWFLTRLDTLIRCPPKRQWALRGQEGNSGRLPSQSLCANFKRSLTKATSALKIRAEGPLGI